MITIARSREYCDMKKKFTFSKIPARDICPEKGAAASASAITGEWELADEYGYDEADTPDGWDSKRFNASFMFGADGNGRYTGGTGGYDLRWKLDADRLKVTPCGSGDTMIYSVHFPAAGKMQLESKTKAAGTPYWKFCNRAMYVKK